MKKKRKKRSSGIPTGRYSGKGILPESWFDLSITMPQDPRELIANANINGTEGEFLYSANFSHPSGSWNSSPLTVSGAPTCASLWTDNQLAVADAAQWNFLHGTKSTDPNLSPLLTNVLYVRAGAAWVMTIPLSTGATTLTDIQLSYRDNAATSGDYVGTSNGGIPAFSFTGSFSGTLNLNITLTKPGLTQLALRAIDNAGNYSMFGFECRLVQ
jgi:hypothetical protein